MSEIPVVINDRNLIRYSLDTIIIKNPEVIDLSAILDCSQATNDVFCKVHIFNAKRHSVFGSVCGKVALKDAFCNVLIKRLFDDNE
jgi:hypothetical protein